MDKIELDNYFDNIKEQKEKKPLNTMTIFGIENCTINENIENNNIDKIDKEGKININEEENIDNKNKIKKKENENIMILEEEIKNEIKNNNDDIMIIEDNYETKNNKNNKKNNNNNTKEKKNKMIKNSNTKKNEKINNEDIESKKEQQKVKKRVRGPNKCYRIIVEFFNDKKRTKNIDNEIKKDNLNKINDEQINEEEEEKKNDNKKNKKRTKITEMSEKFDEFLNFVNEKVNKNYYDLFIYPVISNYKDFYIEKEKQYKENKKNLNDEKINNINMDENLAKRKKSYGLENFLEIPEIVNEFVKYIYNKNIFVTDESKIEMIEIIFIFCTWLKQYHYSSYSVEYLIKNED